MTAELFLAHLLAAHLVVPEPVGLTIGRIKDFGPYEYEVVIVGAPTKGWTIHYDRQALLSSSQERIEFVLAHEVCHAIHDYENDWGHLSAAEQSRRHIRVNECARTAIDAHRKEAWLRRLGDSWSRPSSLEGSPWRPVFPRSEP